MAKIKEFYDNLPQEVRVFIEYILPSAILTAVIDYMTALKIEDIYIAGVINIILIFLRQLKPRIERLRK